MNIEISFGQPKKDAPVIDPGTDPKKFLEIKEKLCTKRKALEEVLAKDPSSAEALSDLAFHKDSMKAFGISEVDYIAFLEKGNKE